MNLKTYHFALISILTAVGFGQELQHLDRSNKTADQLPVPEHQRQLRQMDPRVKRILTFQREPEYCYEVKLRSFFNQMLILLLVYLNT